MRGNGFSISGIEHLILESELYRVAEPEPPLNVFGMHVGPMHFVGTQVFPNLLVNHVNASVIIKNLVNCFLLIGSLGEEHYVREGEKKWVDILSEKQYADLCKHRYVCLGMILVTWFPGDKNAYSIQLLESYVRGYNVGKILMQRVKEKLGASILIPLEITMESRGYWRKILESQYGDRDNFREICAKHGIKESDLSGYEGAWKAKPKRRKK